MSTISQIEANRRNAKKSTGPRSDAGRAAVRRNALKSGIDAAPETALPYENTENLTALTGEYYAEFAPATPQERCLVDALISDEWLLRRFRVIEAQVLIEQTQDRVFKLPRKTVLGDSYSGASRTLERLQRRINATRKSYLATLRALRELQAESLTQPEAPAAAPEPERIPPASAQAETSQPLPLPIGFVPQRTPAGPARSPGIVDCFKSRNESGGIPWGHRP